MFAMIITDYCSIPATFGYLSNVIPKFGNKFKYIVVDNSARKCGLDYLKANKLVFTVDNVEEFMVYTVNIEGQDVTLVDAKSNAGYAGGNNIGTKICNVLFDVDYIIFSNNDITIERLNLSEIQLKFEANQDIGIIGTNVVSPSGMNQNPRKDMSFFSQMIVWDPNILLMHGIFNKYVWNLDTNATESKITGWVSGSFMIVRNKAFQEVGGFDEETFLYAEEMILSEKMRRVGYKTYYLNSGKIIHDHKGANPSLKSLKWNHESRMYYYAKYKGIGQIRQKISDVIFNTTLKLYSMRHSEN